MDFRTLSSDTIKRLNVVRKVMIPCFMVNVSKEDNTEHLHD